MPQHAAEPSQPHAAVAAVAPNGVSADNAVNPSSLPVAARGSGGHLASAPGAANPAPAAAPAAAPKGGAGAAAAAAPAIAAGSSAAGEGRNPEPVAAPEATAAGGEKTLQALMQEATGTSPAAANPASQPTAAQGTAALGAESESASGSVPLRPSLGAINGAIGTAMPGARACVDVDAPVSRASITFNSDGAVGSVSISGWAAGKPAEGCIRAALSKAHVAPFAQPTYTVPATIRSN